MPRRGQHQHAAAIASQAGRPAIARQSSVGPLWFLLLVWAACTWKDTASWNAFAGKPAGAPCGRRDAVACRAGERRFSREKLRSETEEPFAKVKVFFFGFGAIGAFIGLVFILPRLAASLAGLKTAPPVGTVLQDIAVNAGAAALFGFLTKAELDIESMRERRMQEGALLARLPVQLQGSSGATPSSSAEPRLRLGDFRASRTAAGARRAVLCIGSAERCRSWLEDAAPLGAGMAAADLLLVPVPVTSELLPDTLATDALRATAAGLDHVALPEFAAASADWATLCTNEVERVREQGADAGSGLSVVVGKDGRVGMRLLGPPDWSALAKEAGAAKQLGSRI